MSRSPAGGSPVDWRAFLLRAWLVGVLVTFFAIQVGGSRTLRALFHALRQG